VCAYQESTQLSECPTPGVIDNLLRGRDEDDRKEPKRGRRILTAIAAFLGG